MKSDRHRNVVFPSPRENDRQIIGDPGSKERSWRVGQPNGHIKRVVPYGAPHFWNAGSLRGWVDGAVFPGPK